MNPITKIERLRYWQGQTLRSRDLNDQQSVGDWMRWWHNRALHRSFGVRFGLEVAALDSTTSKLTGLRVNCGVAYDCVGRELILRTAAEARLPEELSSGRLMLILRRRKPGSRGTKNLDGCCGDILNPDEPELVWIEASDCVRAAGVPLARVKVEKAVAAIDADFVTRFSRPLARARLGSGQIVPGKISWELAAPAALQARVDTSAAGFLETPCYFARLEVTKILSDDDLSVLTFLRLPTDIVEATPLEFTFRVLSPLRVKAFAVDGLVGALSGTLGAKAAASEGGSKLPNSLVQRLRALGVGICWLGCEMTPDTGLCPSSCDCRDVCDRDA